MLLNNKEFEKAVKDVWCQHVQGHTMYSVWVNLQRLKDKVGQLNKEVSLLERKLDNLTVQLQNVQGKLDADPFNGQLISKEKELLVQIEKWEGINEKVMRQRSRAMWIKCGD